MKDQKMDTKIRAIQSSKNNTYFSFSRSSHYQAINFHENIYKESIRHLMEPKKSYHSLYFHQSGDSSIGLDSKLKGQKRERDPIQQVEVQVRFEFYSGLTLNKNFHINVFLKTKNEWAVDT